MKARAVIRMGALLMVTAAMGSCGSSSRTITATLSPAHGSADQSLSVTVQAVFSAAIAEPSDWRTALTLKRNGAGNTHCTDVTYNSGTLTALCSHADLEPYTTYTASLSGVSGVSNATATFMTGTASGFYLTSSDIASGGTVGATYAYTSCQGSNQSPQLGWGSVPGSAVKLAVTVLDQSNNFVHWILYNIPTTVVSLVRATSVPWGATAATNGYGLSGYGGPCPPTGATHTYRFKLWAVDIADLANASGFNANDNATILAAIEAHAIDAAWFDATYTAP